LYRVEPDKLAATCAHLLDDKQAGDIVLMNVRGLTSIGDYFIVATGRNPRHLRALAREVEDAVERLSKEPLGVEGTPESGWILVDLGDVVVHLFDSERRNLYRLDLLWGDAELEDWAKMETIEAAAEG
jgi:ribosome-associated protein